MPQRVVLLGVYVQFESARCEGVRIILSFALSLIATHLSKLIWCCVAGFIRRRLTIGCGSIFVAALQVVRGRVVCHTYLFARSRLPP